jgi:hypothetical protein
LDEFAVLFAGSEKLQEALADFYAVSVRFCAEVLKFFQGSSRSILLIPSLPEANGESLWTYREGNLETLRGIFPGP